MTLVELVGRIREDLQAGRAVRLHFVEEYAVASVPINVEDDAAENPTFSSTDGRSQLILTSDLEIQGVYRLIEPPQLAVTLTDGQSDVDVLLELRPDDDQYTELWAAGLEDQDN